MDKRTWKRMPTDIRARYRFADEARYYDIVVTDIHHQGCCLRSKKSFERGKELRFTMDVPLEGALYLAGTVVWSDAVSKDGFYRTGIKFIIDNPVAEQSCNKLYGYCLRS